MGAPFFDSIHRRFPPTADRLPIRRFQLYTLARWLIGLTVALPLGAVVTDWFLKRLRAQLGISRPAGRDVPHSMVGLAERLFFTVVIAFDVSGAAIAMIGWIAVKLLPNWELYVRHGATNKPLAFSSLLGSLCSMFFALLGGLICRGAIWWRLF